MMRPRGPAQELYQSVMDAITAHENIKINGGNDIDDVVHISHAPLRRESRDILKQPQRLASTLTI